MKKTEEEKVQMVEVPLELHQKVLNTLSEMPMKYANTLAPIFNELSKCKQNDDI